MSDKNENENKTNNENATDSNEEKKVDGTTEESKTDEVKLEDKKETDKVEEKIEINNEEIKEDLMIKHWKNTVKDVFKLFHNDGDGYISIDNIGVCIRKLGFCAANNEIEKYILPDLIERQRCYNEQNNTDDSKLMDDINDDIKLISYPVFEYKMIELKTQERYPIPNENILFEAFETVQEYLRTKNDKYNTELNDIQKKNTNLDYIYETKYIYKNDLTNVLQNYGSKFSDKEIQDFLSLVILEEKQTKIQYEDYIDDMYQSHLK